MLPSSQLKPAPAHISEVIVCLSNHGLPAISNNPPHTIQKGKSLRSFQRAVFSKGAFKVQTTGLSDLQTGPSGFHQVAEEDGCTRA